MAQRQMISYQNNRHLPECLLVKAVQQRQDYLPVANKIQDTKQYKDRSPDWWRVAHTMTSARAWGRSNRLLTSDICNTGFRVNLHSRKIYGITAFMLNGLYRNKPVFLDDNFLIQEHKFSFGFVPYSSSVVIHQNIVHREAGLWLPNTHVSGA